LSDRVKVLYIAGEGRSGSTILNTVLGQVEGFFAAGELTQLWKTALIEDRPCSCGEPFHACPTWRAIFQAGFGGMDQLDAPRLLAAKNLINSKNPILHVWYTGLITTARRRRHPELLNLADTLGRLFQAISAATGARVIVDASKRPAYGWFLSTLPSVDFYVLHLVRDPRAIAFSRRRGKIDPGNNQKMRDFGPWITGGGWMFWNAATELFWNHPGNTRYLRLRYEDFVSAPRRSLDAILNLVDEPGPSPLVGEDQVMLNPTHTVAGNPNRYESGLTTLRLDDQWVRDIRLDDKALVTALTWPLVLRYAYPLWPRAGSPLPAVTVH